MKRRSFVKKAALGGAVLSFPSIVPAHVLGKNSPSNIINIAQIGCGRIAKDHDMPNTMADSRVRMVAVCDVDSKRAKEAMERVDKYYKQKGIKASKPKVYLDYREMLMDKDIDAVVISTPDHWHSQPAMEAALAGKHIYLQKPTSLTIREGRQLADIVKKTGVTLQMGTQQRSSPQFRIAAEVVRSGRIGKIHTVKIGLPGDPSGPEVPAMPVPSNLNYDMWLGSTEHRPYTEIGVHPQDGYSRPGWLRIEQYGAGMITGWGQHHYDSAAWGMNTELTGPVEVEALASFPKSGLWNVHGDFMVKAEYENGITQLTSGGYTNGIRYEGTEGWVFVSRGNYVASASDPVDVANSSKALDASDPAIIKEPLGENDVHLYTSEEQHKNWIDCIVSGEEPISPIEKGHRACSVCLVSHIAMKLDRKLIWNPAKEEFENDAVANSMLERPQRYPYGTNYVKV